MIRSLLVVYMELMEKGGKGFFVRQKVEHQQPAGDFVLWDASDHELRPTVKISGGFSQFVGVHTCQFIGIAFGNRGIVEIPFSENIRYADFHGGIPPNSLNEERLEVVGEVINIE